MTDFKNITHTKPTPFVCVYLRVLRPKNLSISPRYKDYPASYYDGTWKDCRTNLQISTESAEAVYWKELTGWEKWND